MSVETFGLVFIGLVVASMGFTVYMSVKKGF